MGRGGEGNPFGKGFSLSPSSSPSPFLKLFIWTLEQFQFETLRVSNHTAWRFAEKTRFFRSLWAGRRCAAASRFTFFKGETLYALSLLKKQPPRNRPPDGQGVSPFSKAKRARATPRPGARKNPVAPGDGCQRGLRRAYPAASFS